MRILHLAYTICQVENANVIGAIRKTLFTVANRTVCLISREGDSRAVSSLGAASEYALSRSDSVIRRSASVSVAWILGAGSCEIYAREYGRGWRRGGCAVPSCSVGSNARRGGIVRRRRGGRRAERRERPRERSWKHREENIRDSRGTA